MAITETLFLDRKNVLFLFIIVGVLCVVLKSVGIATKRRFQIFA
jgi:hypothetical protein